MAFIALWLAALLWGPACLAATSQIVEQAFVLDPTGQMTLEQAQQQPQTAYTGNLARLRDHLVVWVRLRVAPPTGAGAATGAPGPATERLRVVPIWSQSLSLYDPLQRDASGRIARLDARPAVALFTLQTLSIPVGVQARDLWLRLEPGGPVYLKTEVLTPQDAAAREVSDGISQGMVIGAQALMILLGVIVWMADKKGIGYTLLAKQGVNLLLAVLNANLFLQPDLPGALIWPEGVGTYVMEGLRLLNIAVSLWFFMKVLEMLHAPRWALQLQRVSLALLAGCLLLLLLVSGQLILARTIVVVLYLWVPLGLMVGSLACQREPLHTVTVLGLARRGAERLALALVLRTAWSASFTGGLDRTQHISYLWWATPIAALSALGVLLLVGWQRIRADRRRQFEQQHRAELNALALDFERSERQRQQEFMSMLTHELKAPLSALGMVIGSATPSASMQRHAGLALASMRQVIDHCAQSAEIDDASTPPQQVACSLATELALRCDAQSEKARIHMATPNALPSVLADPRMLAVMFNNLLDNALKYSPHGSPIRAAIVRETHPQGAVQGVSVTNQALAGPLPDASRMFQKYYRGEAVQRIIGAGLGLHLSRLLARRQGGDLRYEADVRRITFTLVLPELPAATAQEPARSVV